MLTLLVTNRAVRSRIRADRSVRVLISSSLTSKKLQSELLTQGASGWWLFKTRRGSEGNPHDSASNGPADRSTDRFIPPARILSLDEIDQQQFLVHWTRARHGPTPAQSEGEYLDELLLGQNCLANGAGSSDLLNLCRIVAGQRITGTRRLSRSRRAVVCLSEIGLSELVNRPTFQSHLARWDRLPYGVAIRRVAAQNLGARPVIYGDDATWAGLSADQRPFFQSAGGNPSRWREEKEWRIATPLV